VFNILAKPVQRWQFLLGKYLGLLATVAVNLGLMVLLLVVVVWIYQGQLEPRLVFSGAMTLLEMALLAAFATLFAVVTRPMLGSVFTLAVFVIGHVTEDLWALTKHVEAPVTRPLITGLYYLLPNLERFNFKAEVVHGLDIPETAVAWAVVYGLGYTALVLLLAVVRFRHKDLV
jgi:ABC-type transport system involved in multi-copper enzyme maturation permease subunit